MRILLIASQDRADYIEWLLEDEGFNVSRTDRGEEGCDRAKHQRCDAIVLDPPLPDMSGSNVLRRLRENGTTAPVAIVSDETGVEEMSRGFGFGAAADMTVPVDCEELSACLYGVVGRPLPPRRLIEVGELRVDLTRQRVRINGERVHLSTKEYQIVELLALRRGETVTNEAMLTYLYGGIGARDLDRQRFPPPRAQDHECSLRRP